MNNHLKKLSVKATIDNLKRELRGVSCDVKKKSIENLISTWNKVLESLQLVPVLIPVYVNS